MSTWDFPLMCIPEMHEKGGKVDSCEVRFLYSLSTVLTSLQRLGVHQTDCSHKLYLFHNSVLIYCFAHSSGIQNSKWKIQNFS